MLYLYHRKIQRQRIHLRNYKLCELVKVSHSSSDYFVPLLLLNFIKSWCESPISHVTVMTQTLNRTLLRTVRYIFPTSYARDRHKAREPISVSRVPVCDTD